MARASDSSRQERARQAIQNMHEYEPEEDFDEPEPAQQSQPERHGGRPEQSMSTTPPFAPPGDTSYLDDSTPRRQGTRGRKQGSQLPQNPAAGTQDYRRRDKVDEVTGRGAPDLLQSRRNDSTNRDSGSRDSYGARMRQQQQQQRDKAQDSRSENQQPSRHRSSRSHGGDRPNPQSQGGDRGKNFDPIFSKPAQGSVGQRNAKDLAVHSSPLQQLESRFTGRTRNDDEDDGDRHAASVPAEGRAGDARRRPARTEGPIASGIPDPIFSSQNRNSRAQESSSRSGKSRRTSDTERNATTGQQSSQQEPRGNMSDDPVATQTRHRTGPGRKDLGRHLGMSAEQPAQSAPTQEDYTDNRAGKKPRPRSKDPDTLALLTSNTQADNPLAREGPAANRNGQSSGVASNTKAPRASASPEEQVNRPVSKNNHAVGRHSSNTSEEWRHAEVASLTAADLDLGDEGNQAAWWERDANSKGGNDVARTKQYEQMASADQIPNKFTPDLYLACGPLLRFTGIRRSGGFETWNGSVLIVTDDGDEVENPAPTLRLFAQPKKLLPVPPDQIDESQGQLPPEFIDPLAGQTKCGRTGLTLEVRPVEAIPEGRDLSEQENNDGLYRLHKPARQDQPHRHSRHQNPGALKLSSLGPSGERAGKYREVRGAKLYQTKGLTFWRFSVQIELGPSAVHIMYRINLGPAVGFWVPAVGQSMNMMFHSCNGFGPAVNTNHFSGPDPLWRDVLNSHQSRPFHVMIGGGNQLYNDLVEEQCPRYRAWKAIKDERRKIDARFTAEMRDELEEFYLDRYAMWFSSGLFGMANAQIPMVNMWDDHDLLKGFGSFPDRLHGNPVLTGLGAIAFKYYLLFQHHTVTLEREDTEPSWVLSKSLGTYIQEPSHSLFMSMGGKVAFLGIDCRTERTRDEIISEETYDTLFERCNREIMKNQVDHLLILVGVPMAYPRLVFLEGAMGSRVMGPVKSLGRSGSLGGLGARLDGGAEMLGNLDDHWTSSNHKGERNWLIQELQQLAAEKSVRITLLSGDVRLGAVGQFYSSPTLNLPKDQDHRYMPNVVSSTIAGAPPPSLVADALNRRNKIHHLDDDTDEDMIPLFMYDVDGKPRKNACLLPRRNWCSIREYQPESSPPQTPSDSPTPPGTPPPNENRPNMLRSLSQRAKDRLPGGLVRRISRDHPPSSYLAAGSAEQQGYDSRGQPIQNRPDQGGHYSDELRGPQLTRYGAMSPDNTRGQPQRPGGGLQRRDTRTGAAVNLHQALEITLNVECNQGDPSGITVPYRLIVPSLNYNGPGDRNTIKRQGTLKRMLSGRRKQSFNQNFQGGSFDSQDQGNSRNTSNAGSNQPLWAAPTSHANVYDTRKKSWFSGLTRRSSSFDGSNQAQSQQNKLRSNSRNGQGPDRRATSGPGAFDRYSVADHRDPRYDPIARYDSVNTPSPPKNASMNTSSRRGTSQPNATTAAAAVGTAAMLSNSVRDNHSTNKNDALKGPQGPSRFGAPPSAFKSPGPALTSDEDEEADEGDYFGHVPGEGAQLPGPPPGAPPEDVPHYAHTPRADPRTVNRYHQNNSASQPEPRNQPQVQGDRVRASQVISPLVEPPSTAPNQPASSIPLPVRTRSNRQPGTAAEEAERRRKRRAGYHEGLPNEELAAAEQEVVGRSRGKERDPTSRESTSGADPSRQQSGRASGGASRRSAIPENLSANPPGMQDGRLPGPPAQAAMRQTEQSGRMARGNLSSGGKVYVPPSALPPAPGPGLDQQQQQQQQQRGQPRQEEGRRRGSMSGRDKVRQSLGDSTEREIRNYGGRDYR